jgi:alkylation response protein AidB-like acyl-CoA dehydrogenase
VFYPATDLHAPAFDQVQLAVQRRLLKALVNCLCQCRVFRQHRALGIALGVYEHAAEYAKERIQFNKRLVDFQGIQWKLADMEMLLEATRGMIYKAAAAKDAGHPLGVIVSQAKLFAATYCPLVVDQALQRSRAPTATLRAAG